MQDYILILKDFRIGLSLMILVVLWFIAGAVFSERHIRKGEEKRETGYLLLLIFSQTLMLICSIIRDSFLNSSNGLDVVRIMQFLCYLFMVAGVFLISHYIVDYLKEYAFIHNNVNYIIAFICGSLAILWSVGFFQPVNWFFSFDPYYIRTARPFYIVMQFIPSLILIFDLLLAASFSNLISKYKIRAWVLITITPVIAAVCESFIGGFPTEALSALSGVVLYINIYVSKTRQMVLSQKELTESKAKLMVSQIQPHFIYNSLNTIYYLIEQDTEQAQEAVSTFSDYLRQNINSLKDDKPVKFEEELAHTEAYISLELLRFGDELKIEKDIKATDFYIPPLTIQPLVENAIKHGISIKEGGGTVKIESLETDDSYMVIIADDGVGFEAGKFKDSASTHIGLFNVNSRIKTMCNGSLQVTSVPGKGTKCIITLPKSDAIK